MIPFADFVVVSIRWWGGRGIKGSMEVYMPVFNTSTTYLSFNLLICVKMGRELGKNTTLYM